jgi:hypothetical protein
MDVAMKKRYLTKSDMARDISVHFSISLQDAKSRLSRENPPLTLECRQFQIEGEKIKITFWLTPDKYLG